MWADMRAAFSFLTILPLGYAVGRRPGWSFAAYPLVGLVIGLLLAAIRAAAPFTTSVTAFVLLAAWVFITGGLHLDGFGDACDGLFATVEPMRRLEIMKDPRTGAWAVIGLIVLLLGKWTTLQTVSPILLIVPPVIGRWVMVLAVFAFPYARKDGLGAFFRDGFEFRQVAIASVCTIVITVVVAAVVDGRVLTLPIVGLGIAFGVGHWAAGRLNGGLTGDIYGALCEVTEIACLLGMSLWAHG